MKRLSEIIMEYGNCKVQPGFEKLLVKKPKSIQDIEYGDTYYYINPSNGCVNKAIWKNEEYAKTWCEFGLVYLTEEEAIYELESMKVHNQLKVFASKFTEEDWKNDSIKKYQILFNHEKKEIEIYLFYLHSNSGSFYFESKERAREAIEAVGEENVKKYYLGVRE